MIKTSPNQLPQQQQQQRKTQGQENENTNEREFFWMKKVCDVCILCMQ